MAYATGAPLHRACEDILEYLAASKGGGNTLTELWHWMRRKAAFFPFYALCSIGNIFNWIVNLIGIISASALTFWVPALPATRAQWISF